MTYKCGSYADQGLNKIPDSVTDEQALLVGDVLATGFWAARISEITEEDTVLIIGAGPTGLCTLMCVLLKNPKRVIVCEKDPASAGYVRQESDLQNRRCGRLRLRRNSRPHRSRKDRHPPADHPPL